jgi:hypothetical protein
MPSKVNHSIKEMVEKALHKAGGVDYLTHQAHENPVAFMGLVGRVLPLQLAGHDGGRLEVEFRWRDEPSLAPVIDSIATSVDTTTNVDTEVGSDAVPSVIFIGEC